LPATAFADLDVVDGAMGVISTAVAHKKNFVGDIESFSRGMTVS